MKLIRASLTALVTLTTMGVCGYAWNGRVFQAIVMACMWAVLAFILTTLRDDDIAVEFHDRREP